MNRPNLARIRGLAIVPLLVLLCAGCFGGHASLSVETSPKYANVYVDGYFIGTTPLWDVVPPALDGATELKVEHRGHEPEVRTILLPLADDLYGYFELTEE